jgi:hypothetical protein
MLIAVPRFVGQDDRNAHSKKIEELHKDIALIVNCVKNVTDAQEVIVCVVIFPICSRQRRKELKGKGRRRSFGLVLDTQCSNSDSRF